MSRYAFLLALAMAWLADGHHSRLPPVAFATQAQAAVEAGYLYEVDPVLLVAIAWEESRFRPELVSDAGACGPMQVNPVWVPWSCSEVRAPRAAYRAGAWALVRWVVHCEGDPLACYNAGGEPGRRGRWYAARVRRTARDLRRRMNTAWVIWARR